MNEQTITTEHNLEPTKRQNWTALVIPNLVKDTQAYKYKYAPLEKVTAHVQLWMDRHNLATGEKHYTKTSMTTFGTGMLLITYEHWVNLDGYHILINSVSSPIATPDNTPEEKTKDDKVKMSQIQAFGSIVTYIRRYLIMLLYNFCGEAEDDDGANTTRVAIKRDIKPVLNGSPTPIVPRDPIPTLAEIEALTKEYSPLLKDVINELALANYITKEGNEGRYGSLRAKLDKRIKEINQAVATNENEGEGATEVDETEAEVKPSTAWTSDPEWTWQKGYKNLELFLTTMNDDDERTGFIQYAVAQRALDVDENTIIANIASMMKTPK